MNTKFILGEEKYVSFEVIPTRNEEFEIIQARWKLLKEGEVESEGESRIDGHMVSSLVCPKYPYRSYSLVVTYLIGNETLSALITIEVVNPR
jgi:hypothetical protein